MALLETAAQLLAEGGPDLLTLRRLTSQVGTSTMAVYTHFGSMDVLVSEVAVEAFARLRRRLDEVVASDDPVTDLAALGSAYLANATENPNLYQVIFGPSAGREMAAAGLDTFEVLIDGVRRCISAGRFDDADPVVLATQMWAAIHGSIVLAHAGLFSPEQLVEVVSGSARNLFVGFGDSPASVDASLARACWEPPLAADRP